MKSKYNLDKLVRVIINDFSPSEWYTFNIGYKLFGFTIKREGFYKKILHNTYIGENIPENHTLKDGVVYENPEVILSYQGNYQKTYYFNSLQEAESFANELTKNGNWIN